MSKYTKQYHDTHGAMDRRHAADREDVMRYKIKNRWSGNVQFTANIDRADDAPASVKVGLAVKWAVKSGVDLSGADLYGADLSRTNLSRATLSGADLSRADLSRATLSGADLSRANLYGANLSRATLSGVDLSGADLYGADLSRTTLSGADLSRADLSGANLYGADLSGANLRGGISRTDGYQFWIIQTDDGPHIRAGCRWLSLSDARQHWKDTRGGTPLGDETMRILDFLVGEAKAAGWM